MINPFRKVGNNIPERHILLDIEEWDIDSEYAVMGMNEGWLVKTRIRDGPDKVIHYYILRNRSS